jgi:hypothetical protein
MRVERTRLAVAWSVLTLAACRGPERLELAAEPSASGVTSAAVSASATERAHDLRIVAHAPSTTLTNIQPFIDAKCTPPANQRWTIGAGEEIVLDCSHATFHASTRCGGVVVDGSLGDLAPYHPIALCQLDAPERAGDGPPADDGDLGSIGCRNRRPVAYLVADRQGAFRVVRTRAELAKIYAPITAPAEAESWVLLGGGGPVARHEFRVPSDAKLSAESVDASHAERAGDGFRVHLFDSPGCGCHADALTAVDLFVASDGAIREEARRPIYSTTHTICRD